MKEIDIAALSQRLEEVCASSKPRSFGSRPNSRAAKFKEVVTKLLKVEEEKGPRVIPLGRLVKVLAELRMFGEYRTVYTYLLHYLRTGLPEGWRTGNVQGVKALIYGVADLEATIEEEEEEEEEDEDEVL